MEEMKLGHGECRKGLQQAVPDMYTLGRSAAGNCAYQSPVCARVSSVCAHTWDTRTGTEGDGHSVSKHKKTAAAVWLDCLSSLIPMVWLD